MKKMVSFLVATLMLVCMALPVATAEDTPSNILIAYFTRVGITDFPDDADVISSASLNLDDNGEFVGNNMLVADYVHEATGGDLFQILTVDTYPSDYDEAVDFVGEERRAGTHPTLQGQVQNMEAYDTIVLVYPNWWGTLPPPIYSFLESYDLSGKTIAPLCTHGGSSLGDTVQALRTFLPDTTILEGLAVRAADAPSAKDAVQGWLEESGIVE